MTFAFENFELDVARAELRRDGAPVPIEPQVFELIKLLVSASDRIVTRDEIFEVIWGNRIVSDAALSSRIRDARKAIGDNGTAQRLIRTVHRRGLRFVGDVRDLSYSPPAARCLFLNQSLKPPRRSLQRLRKMFWTDRQLPYSRSSASQAIQMTLSSQIV